MSPRGAREARFSKQTYNRAMVSLSVIVPALDEAAGIERMLQGLQPMRSREVETIYMGVPA